jgi:2,3-bisphosphoglycerate-independent phosphoglycerate mutase
LVVLYIERVDKALVDLVDDVDNIVISSDHSTSSETGHHTGDPVPSILTYPGSRRDSVKEFSESSCMQGGGLNGLNSTQLLLMLLDGMGVLRNYQHGYSWLI